MENNIPQGLTMALAHNSDAMLKFVSMNDSEKKAVIGMTKGIESKEQMQNFVNNGFKL